MSARQQPKRSHTMPKFHTITREDGTTEMYSLIEANDPVDLASDRDFQDAVNAARELNIDLRSTSRYNELHEWFKNHCDMTFTHGAMLEAVEICDEWVALKTA